MKECKIIGIAGGSGSGKTTLAKQIFNKFGEVQACLISQDSYYIDQSKNFDHDGGAINFDHPDALEFKLLAKNLNDLKHGKEIEIPIYDFATHKRLAETKHLTPKKIIIVEGILLFHHDFCCELLDQLVYVDAPEDIRFKRRLKRDTEERGRTEQGVHDQFFKQVKPMHDQFVEPCKKKANNIISGEKPYDEFIESL